METGRGRRLFAAGCRFFDGVDAREKTSLPQNKSRRDPV
jgi:hypothetical protein